MEPNRGRGQLDRVRPMGHRVESGWSWGLGGGGDRRVKQWDRVAGWSGYGCSSSHRLHFGLGKSDRVPAISVRWPSGSVTRLEDIAAGQIIEISEAPTLQPPLEQRRSSGGRARVGCETGAVAKPLVFVTASFRVCRDPRFLPQQVQNRRAVRRKNPAAQNQLFRQQLEFPAAEK